MEKTHTTKSKKFAKDENGRPLVASNIPAHLVDVGLLIKGNNNLRRAISIELLKHLREKGLVDADCNYVQFNYGKYSVKSNNLVKEYSYADADFVKIVSKAFTVFAKDVEAKLGALVTEENLVLSE